MVYGADDPNPNVKGGGGYYLARKGVSVTSGVRATVCQREHRFFFTAASKGRPHVLLKTAATLDGRIAARTGDSRWVTGPKARRQVHRLRNWLDAICVGSGTALADDPRLTCRLKGGRGLPYLVRFWSPSTTVASVELQAAICTTVPYRNQYNFCRITVHGFRDSGFKGLLSFHDKSHLVNTKLMEF